MWPYEEYKKYPFSAESILDKFKIGSNFLIKINIGAIIVLIGIIGCVIPNIFSTDCLMARGSLELLSFIHLSGTMLFLALFYAGLIPIFEFSSVIGAIITNLWIWSTRLLGATKQYNWAIRRLAHPDETINQFLCWMYGMFFALGMALFISVTLADTRLLRHLHEWPSLVADRERMRQICRETITESKPDTAPAHSGINDADPSTPMPKRIGQ